MEQTSEEKVEVNKENTTSEQTENEKSNEEKQVVIEEKEVVVVEDDNSSSESEEKSKDESESVSSQGPTEQQTKEIPEEVEEVEEVVEEIVEEVEVEEKSEELKNTKSDNVENESCEKEEEKVVSEVKEAEVSVEDSKTVDNSAINESKISEEIVKDSRRESVVESEPDNKISIQTPAIEQQPLEKVEEQIQSLNISVTPKLQEEKCIIQETQNENIEIKIRKTEKVIENEKENHFNVDSPSRPHLQKIFTPAEDAPPPKNRKNFASSAFYSPNHPTVEDQVNLARRISHSLSDISNQQSKGQTMYVNRKKRSVKWVHESNEGQSEFYEEKEEIQENKPNNFPLKVVMNPRGKIRDLSSLPSDELISDTGLLSPTKCKELVSALNEPSGKGAELFAKRRKRAEKWATEDENAENQANFYQNREQFYPAQQSHETFENRNYNDAYTKPEIYNQAPKEPSYNVKTQPVAAPINNREYYDSPDNVNRSYEPKPVYQPNTPLTQRDLAYKPSIAQGWKSRPINLPTGLYVPKEIPLESYQAPPKTENFLPKIFNVKPVVNNYQNNSWMNEKPISNNYQNNNSWISSNEKPISNNLQNNNSWIHQNEKSSQDQIYYNAPSSQPIRSPWHEMERNAQKSQAAQQYNSPIHHIPQQVPYQPVSYKPPMNNPVPEPRRHIFSKSEISNQNFNTAARGWNGSKFGNSYKPITFGQQPKSVCMQYTDF